VIKEYEESQFLEWQNLAELVETYELIMHIAFKRVFAR
jgi:hypothetical protein